RDALGVNERKADCEHAAGGVAQNSGALNPEMIEEPDRIRGQEVETVADVGLRRLTPADLIGHNYAIPRRREKRNNIRPVISTEILTVHEHDCAAVWRTGWRHIHIAHTKVL